MKTRHVFSTADLIQAEAAIRAARAAGIADEDISLIARDDIELAQIPAHRQEARSDFFPAALRGVLGGGASGLLAGLIAVVVTPIGLTLAGAGALALAGAMVGGWASALAGASVPDPVTRKFEEAIKSGHILVVLDADKALLEAATPAVVAVGAIPLPFDTPTVLT